LRAAYFKEHGGADKILYGDYPDPVPEANEVVVRVRACALNQVDMLLLDGRFPPPEGLPHVNGCEVTGTIEASGAAAGRRRNVGTSSDISIHSSWSDSAAQRSDLRVSSAVSCGTVSRGIERSGWNF